MKKLLLLMSTLMVVHAFASQSDSDCPAINNSREVVTKSFKNTTKTSSRTVAK